jgi:hypothetical protein
MRTYPWAANAIPPYDRVINPLAFKLLGQAPHRFEDNAFFHKKITCQNQKVAKWPAFSLGSGIGRYGLRVHVGGNLGRSS